MVSQMVALTQQVFTVVEQELQLTSFWESIPARKKLRAEIQKVLLSPDFFQIPNLMDNREQIISRVMEIAEKNNDRIF
jgi:type I restriction enzyme R subunit